MTKRQAKQIACRMAATWLSGSWAAFGEFEADTPGDGKRLHAAMQEIVDELSRRSGDGPRGPSVTTENGDGVVRR